MRVPTIAWWPGRIKSNSSVDTVTGIIDLLPTAVALAGGTLPKHPVIDGKDISPILLGKTTQSSREAQYYFMGFELQAVRQGPWKLALVPQKETMGRSVLADAKTKAPRLYNLDNEIGEKNNVAASHPKVVAKLTALAQQKNAEIGGRKSSARRPAGKVEKPVMLYPTERRKKRAKNGK